ncbi:MAG TPA: hypothetical protein VEX35_01960 [Allosphingosinicella sp.]|nr:hypothetical protein [Allosphingosinicella sp.]
MRALFAFAAALLLAGCWEGESLHSAADARPAIEPGLYRTVSETGEVSPSVLRISTQADGMTRFQAVPGGENEWMTIGFAPLDPEGRAFAAWTVPGGIIEGGSAVTYGLLRRGGDGSYVYIVPMCDRSAAIAGAAGGGLEGRDAPVCRFTSRASIEAALRALPADAQALGEVVRLVRADPAPNP